MLYKRFINEKKKIFHRSGPEVKHFFEKLETQYTFLNFQKRPRIGNFLCFYKSSYSL